MTTLQAPTVEAADASANSVAADEDDDLEPTAGLSSAASCIRISLLGYPPFRPVYTHQCFDGEHIPGWSPTDEAQNEARATADRLQREANIECNVTMLPHSSYRYQKENYPRLDINVILSPDCTFGSVNIEQTSPPPSPSNDDDNTSASCAEMKKRLIVDTTNTNEENNTEILPAAKRQKRSISFADHVDEVIASASASATVDAPTTSSTSLERMDIKDIVSNLRRALPNLVEKDGVVRSIADGYIQKPHGTILNEYSRKIRMGDGKEEEDGDFVITLADGSDKAVSEYHNKVQGLATFFIETADNVDLSSDEGGGYWKVLYLFRRHCEGKYSLVGYTTLFHFHSPFKKPKPGIVMRVCQALILPPYQRGGHGSMMLLQIYTIDECCHDTGSDIVEVNVEEPAPGFVALRNKIDFNRFKSSSAYGPENEVVDRKYLGGNVGLDGPVLKRMHSGHLYRRAKQLLELQKLRITPQQIYIAHEMFKLYALEAHITFLRGALEHGPPDKTTKDKQRAVIDAKVEGLEKKYRLMVKKRLLKAHREELGACGGKEEQKARLGEIFDETLQHYRSLL